MTADTGAGMLEPQTLAFYQQTLTTLEQSGIPFMVGGAYAFSVYTGIERHTKDFDIFVRQQDAERTLGVLGEQGCMTELTFPHWLGKAFCGSDFIDVIFSSGNGLMQVDAEWFDHAVDGEVFGHTVKLVPAEEMIWTKSLIMERERYDGADVAHILRARGTQIDWRHLVNRFGTHWRVLLSHLILFNFIYPSEREQIPAWVLDELLNWLAQDRATPPDEKICQGTLISRQQYLIDVTRWGYRDARRDADVAMSPDDIAHWTAAIDTE
jgi:hypothetical protein